MAKKHRILVVDDEQPLLLVLSIELESEGYSVATASDGEEALVILEKERFDLVLLDIKMPRVDGFEVLKVVKQRWPETKVVILTGHADLKNAIASKKLGAEDFVSKPYDLVDLLVTVERILEKDAPEAELERLSKLIPLLESRIKLLEEENSSLSNSTISLSTLNSLIAGLSHSAKGELTNINAAALEIKVLSKNNQDVVDDCEVISRSAEFAQLLLRRMIDFTLNSRVQRTAIDPTDFAEKVNELVKPRLPSKIQLDLVIDPNLTNSKFLADREETLVVLTELVNNSITALRDIGGTIRISFEKIGGNMKISVFDNGPGIPMEIRKSLLSERVESTKGLGIGLYLCSKIMASMDGKLEFVTGEGNGTTFLLLLPLAQFSQEN